MGFRAVSWGSGFAVCSGYGSFAVKSLRDLPILLEYEDQAMTTTDVVTLARSENQALALGQYALDFLAGRLGEPGPAAIEQVELFHLDSVACAVSALALGASAPRILRAEALEYAVADPTRGATCFGSAVRVWPEKAVVANSSAVREWDSNGTNFGYNPARGYTRGEFGHNDFYPVVIAAAQQRGLDGRAVVRGMLLVDEIRGRLAEAFALRSYKIDHVVHGAIASAAVYAAMLGATPEQIESAIGMVVAHYIPFRAIRAGKQLSDSKGASAAISAEVAVLSAARAMRGFRGPADIFRNPEAIFCLFEKPAEPKTSPFDLTLAAGGDDFAVRDMHFKLGLYEHQSAGAIQGVLDILRKYPALLETPDQITRIEIEIYEPAYSIIGDPAKRDPRTRQSADHSMVYIIGTLLRKAIERRQTGWIPLMLLPADYDDAVLFHPLTRRLMERMEFRHGGPEYDALYPEGIPTTVLIEHAELGRISSGLVMFPLGHARQQSAEFRDVLAAKHAALITGCVDDPADWLVRMGRVQSWTASEVASIYSFGIRWPQR